MTMTCLNALDCFAQNRNGGTWPHDNNILKISQNVLFLFYSRSKESSGWRAATITGAGSDMLALAGPIAYGVPMISPGPFRFELLAKIKPGAFIEKMNAPGFMQTADMLAQEIGL